MVLGSCAENRVKIKKNGPVTRREETKLHADIYRTAAARFPTILRPVIS